MRPRLLVNAKWRSQPRVSGVQRYAEGLAGALHLPDIDVDFAQPEHAGRLRGMLWEQRTLPRIAKDYNALLCPANMAPTRLEAGTRLLVVLHCLRFHFHPGSYSKPFVRWYERMVPRIIDRADVVFTVSDAQQHEIEQVYPHGIGKVKVLRPGLDSSFHPHHARDGAVPDGRYMVALSTPAPAKNLATLLCACEMVETTIPLVLVGVDSRELDIICPSSVRDRVIALGHLGDPDRIASILSHADVLLAPSRYESFGLPCLEAMGCATPVIASDLAAHREVCGDAGVFVDPDDADAWASSIDQLIRDEHTRQEIANAGYERARQFRWGDAARILGEVLGQSGRVAAR